MSFNFPDIPESFTTQQLIGQFNSFLMELGNYLNGQELTKPKTYPVQPYDGQLVYVDGYGWTPPAGKGLYMYQDGTYIKLTREGRQTRDAVGGTLNTATPYTIVSGEVTVPMTVWKITGTTAKTVNLTLASTVGRLIGFLNESTHEATINYGAVTKTMELAPSGLATFIYKATGWEPYV